MEPSPWICCLKASYTVKWYVIIPITPWRPPSQALTLKHQVTSAKSMMARGLKPYGGYWSYYSKCYMNCIQGKAAHFMQRGTFREVDSHTNQRDDLTVCVMLVMLLPNLVHTWKMIYISGLYQLENDSYIHILQVMIVLSSSELENNAYNSSTQVQQVYFTKAKTPLLLLSFFFLSAFIGSWRTNFKLVCVNAALIKSPKAIWLCIIGDVNRNMISISANKR